MAGKKGQKKRFWSDEEKRRICGQARAPGVSGAQVARRYAMDSNLLFTWLRDPRFASADHEISRDPGDGLYYKVLEKGRFPWPSAKDGSVRLTSAQLAMLWEGIDWRRPDWGAPPARVG